jgi:hypothetical protein
MDVGYGDHVWPVNASCNTGIRDVLVGQNDDRPVEGPTFRLLGLDRYPSDTL